MAIVQTSSLTPQSELRATKTYVSVHRKAFERWKEQQRESRIVDETFCEVMGHNIRLDDIDLSNPDHVAAAMRQGVKESKAFSAMELQERLMERCFFMAQLIVCSNGEVPDYDSPVWATVGAKARELYNKYVLEDIYVGDDGKLHVTGEHQMMAGLFDDNPDLKQGYKTLGGVLALAAAGGVAWWLLNNKKQPTSPAAVAAKSPFEGAIAKLRQAGIIVLTPGHTDPRICNGQPATSSEVTAEQIIGHDLWQSMSDAGYAFERCP